MEMPLSKLLKGQKATISVVLDSSSTLRLYELGVVPGVELLIKAIAPFGSSYAIQLADFSLSIRKEDAQNIIVITD